MLLLLIKHKVRIMGKLNNKIVAIDQARTTSNRLPNKVMHPILGTPMIIHQLDRINRSDHIDQLIVATGDHSTDDELTQVCKGFGYNVSRGSFHNVVDRIWCAVEKVDYDQLVRLSDDCPLKDAKIIDLLLGSIYRKARITVHILLCQLFLMY